MKRYVNSMKSIFEKALNETIDEINKGVKKYQCIDCSITNYNFIDAKWVHEIPTTIDDLFDRKEINDFLLGVLKKKCVIYLLESPHIDEFINEPYFPAKGMGNGDTGKLLSDHMVTILNKYIVSESDIFIMNRIQYQTSLGWQDRKIKESVFNKMWQDSTVYNDLIHRVQTIVEKYEEIVIFDCNTKIIRGLINKNDIFENAEQSNITMYTFYHPSSWFKKENQYETKDTGKRKVKIANIKK